MSFKKKIYLKYITCIIHTWFLSKTNSIKHDTLTDNVNMVCPSTFETFQGSFVNRIAAYSFDTQNGNYQMEGFIKSIDLSPSNLPNNSFNSSNGNGYIYAVGNGNNKLLISLTGNSYTDIENFDILISMAYEIKNGSYNLTLTSYHENSSPYYVQITNSSSYMWHIYNARFPVNGSFILNIYGSGFGRLDDICLFQVCSEGYAFDYSVDKCKATSLQPFNTTTMQSLITKATEALTATTTKDLIISMTYRLVENIATPLVNGKILAVLPSIEKEYLVSFDFYPNSIPNDMFYAVIRLTNTTGINYASNGYHIPGIYLFSSGYLQIASSLNGNGFGFFNTYPISVKEWINIEISQILICEDYVYRIKLNGNYVYLQINHQSQRFKNVTVYASDFSWPTDGLIKNLYVSTGNATTLTEPPNTVAMKSTTITTVKAPTTTSSTDAPTTSKTINFITTTDDPIISTFYWLVKNFATPLVNGKILTVLSSIEKEYLVSFEFYPNSFPPNGFYSIIRFTNISESDDIEYNVSSVYLHSSGSLLIASSMNGDGFRYFNTDAIILKNWIIIEISQVLKCGQYVYTIKLNGVVVYVELNYQSQRFNKIRVYAADITLPTDGYIKNLYVFNGNTNPCYYKNCYTSSYCSVVSGIAVCSCPNGFKLQSDTTTCVHDPCYYKNCYNSDYCSVVSGIALCSCPNGYKLQSDNTTCVQDPCYFKKCYTLNYCSVVLGIAMCSCPIGFKLQSDNITCLQDPCYLKNCYTSNYCSVLSGIAVCSCPIGFILQSDNTTCIQDLCYYKNCYNSTYCSVVSGVAICSCAIGFKLQSDNTTCVQDPCYYKNCYNSNYCSVVSGVAMCSCPIGFKLQPDSTICVQDPCYYKNCYSSNYCRVMSGYAVCSCPIGLKLQSDGITCVQDPCYYKNCYNLTYCSVVSSVAMCSCPIGFKLQSDGTTCVQDPCHYKNCNTSNFCIVVSGIAVCSCPNGLKLQPDGISCVEDPCYFKNCYTLSYCNVVSGYAVCSCPNGFKLQSDGITCVLDPCYYKNCYNLYYCSVVSGYAVCSCPIGFKLQPDNITCVQDPCYYKNCYNTTYCSVVSGVAMCSCPIGFKLQSDNTTCVQDPCYYKSCYTSNYCSIVSGYAMCSCPIGFKLQFDNITCIQDPCYYKNCYTSNYCSVVSGFAVCFCPNGFNLQSDNITCVKASLFSIELFNSKTAVIVIATLGVVLFVFIVIFAVTVVLFKKKKKSQLPMANAFLQTIEYNNQVTSHETIADEWEIYPECFLIDKKIGGGAYSTVFMVKINAKILSKTKHANRSIASLPALNKNCRSNVAVKFLKAGASQLEINDFKEEINIMKKIGYHHNILNMLGCSTVKKPLCLVTEYMENGDLLQFLCDRRTTLQVQNDESIVYASTYQRSLERPITTNSTTEAIYHDILLEDVEKITPRDLLSFAYQVASGMEYLSKINVVHRNLSASNILVGAKKNVKISDFGLSRKIQNESQYIGNKIRHVPIKWMSIEALLDLVFMSYSDVWAFGVVLFEIVTLGGTPYPTISNHKLLGFLKSGCRMDRPENCSTIIYNIMLHCWSEDPLQRPTFSELRNHLEELLLQGGFYFSFDINENNVYYNATSFNHLPSETGNGSHEVERIRNAHITV
nr:uncharacterized protein LOC105845628 isoform X3 [Hydra vulgaris]